MSDNLGYDSAHSHIVSYEARHAESIAAYLTTLAERRRSPHTLKAARQDLTRFVAWWESQYARPFDPALLLDTDLRDWRRARQQDDGAAPATINRALSTLRGYCAWAVAAGLMTESAARDIEDVPTPELSPRGLPAPAVKALLRAARAEHDVIIRLRDEAALALLIYGGLRVQEACDLQLRDVDLAGLSITVRYGKAGKARRVPLHADAQRLLQRYLDQVRCPNGLPAVGSDAERAPLLAGMRRARPSFIDPIFPAQPAPQPVEQLPVPLFDGVVLAARTHDGAIYLALRDLCATLGLTLRAQQRRIRTNEALHLTLLRIMDGRQFRTLDFLLLDDVPIWIMANKSIAAAPVASRVPFIPAVLPILTHGEKKSYARTKNAALYAGLNAPLAFHATPSAPGLKKGVQPPTL